MKKLNDKEIELIDKYIKKEMTWIDDFKNLSPEMKLAVFNTFGFQVYLLKHYWRQLKFLVLASTRRILERLRYKK